MREHNNHNNAPNVASMTAIVLLATSFKCVTAAYTYIAGYEPRSTVTSHNNIDLDVKAIMTHADWPSNNGEAYKVCTGDGGDACKWDSDGGGSTMYPTLWNTDCTHSGTTVSTTAACTSPYGIYKSGKNSLKDDSVRSIYGFANSIGGKSSGPAGAEVAAKDNAFIGAMNTYFASKGLNELTWGKDIIEAAFKGAQLKKSDNTVIFDFGIVGGDFRKEVIQKGMIYLNIFPYVIWEMQDAINDCKSGSLTSNDAPVGGASVHAWDEAVAFYTGSLEGTTKGGVTGYSGGYLQYYLAEKRCENYGTCTASYNTNTDVFSGESKINEEIIALFQRGEAEITAAVDSTSSTKCDKPARTMEEIATKMLVPFIQGTFRYLYKTRTSSGRTAKQAGELFAFATTILPFVHAADPTAAELLYKHVWEMPASPDSDLKNYAHVKSAIEATYPNLGFGAGKGTIKCSDIGSLGSLGNTLMSACTDATVSTIEDFAGYEPITDVTLHSRIDLDLEAIASSSNIGGTCSAKCKLSDCSVTSSVKADGTGCNYDATTLAFPNTVDSSLWTWINGKNSLKSDNVMRTIRGFVSGAKGKASGNSPATKDVAYKANKFIAIMNKYWLSKSLDEHTWGEQMIKAAFEGTKVGTNTHLDFSTVGRDFRKEAIQKGIVYTNIFPYVIWEMQDAVNDCNAKKHIDAVHAWDTAVALYAGSKTRGKGYGIHGPDGGNLQYRLADKRCQNFKTCADGFAGTAQVNQDIFALFNLGKEITQTDCAALNSLAEKIGTLALIPFVQSTLRYLWSTKIGQTAKDAGELWAFATAILPFVAEADANAGEMLYNRAWQLDFSSNSYEEVKTALERTYPKLGAGAGVGLVTCEAVGNLYFGPSDAQRSSTHACSSPSRPEASTDLRLVGGLTFLAIALTALSVYTCILKRRAEKKYSTAVFQGMGNRTGPQV